MKRKWTNEELQTLIDNIDKTDHEIAVLLSRTSNSVRYKRYTTGYREKTSRWKLEEVDILIANIEKSDSELSKLIGRNINSIITKRLKLGLFRKTPNGRSGACSNVYWTQKEIEILNKHGPNLSSYDLTELLPRHTQGAIQSKYKSLKIPKSKYFLFQKSRNTKYHYKINQNFNINDLDNITYQVLIGSILGDGGIVVRQSGSCYYKEGHCVKQRDYLAWKKDILKIFYPSDISCKKPTIVTPVHPIFNTLRQDFYGEKIIGGKTRKGCIPVKYIDRLDLFGLLVWYLDDGDTPRGPNICSSLFSEEDLNLVTNIINSKFDMSLEVSLSTKSNIKKIKFLASNRDKVMPIWDKLFYKYNIPNCMRYKLYKQYSTCVI